MAGWDKPTEREIRSAWREHGIELGTVTPLTPMPERYPAEALAEMRGNVPEVEVDEFPRFSYRDADENIIAEWDDGDAGNEVLGTLIRDGHPTLLLWVDGKRALGSYGDYGEWRGR